MALNVGELVAFLKLDKAQFDQGMGQAEGKFSGLQKTFASSAKAMAGGLVTTGLAATALGISVFKTGAEYNRLQQSSRAALSTLLGGAEAANAQMDKLDEFARTSPFAKQVFITAQQQLLGFGVAAENVIPTLDAVQNAVAAVGGSNEQVSQVTYALAQMQGQGKLTGETLNQLGQYGIDAATILGKEMGKTGAEIRALASKPGGIPVDQVFKPLTDGLMKRFGGATANIKQQMDGATDRIKGASRDIGSALAAPFIDPKGGGQAVEWTNKVADAMRAAETKIKPLVDILVQRFQPQLDKISPALDQVRGIINSWDMSRINNQLDAASKYAPLIAGLGTAFVAFGTGSIPILGQFLPAINPVVAGIAALVAASPELRGVVVDAFKALQPIIPIATDLGLAVADVAMTAISLLTPALADLVEAAGPVAFALAGSLAPAALSVLEASLPLIEILADVVTWMSKLPEPVLITVAAMIALNGPVGTVAKTLGGAFATAIGAVSEHMKAAKGTAEALGTDVGIIGTAAIGAKAGVTSLGTAMKSAFISSGIGLAIAGVSAVLGIFIAKNAEAKQFSEALRGSLDETTGAITKQTEELMLASMEAERGFFNKRAGKSMMDDAEALGLSLQLVKDAMLGNVDAMEQVEDARRAHMEAGFDDRKQQDEARAMWDHVTNGIKDNAGSLEEAQEKQRRFNEMAGLGTETQQKAAEANRLHTEAILGQIDAQREAAGSALSQAEASLRSKDAQDRAAEALREHTELQKSGKASTEELERSARNLETQNLNLVRSWATEVEAMAKNNVSAKELDATIKIQRETFIKQQEAIGMSTKEAEKLADTYGLIPNRVETEVRANTAKAREGVEAFIWQTNQRTATITVTTKGQTSRTGYGGQSISWSDGGFQIPAYANGKMPDHALIQRADPGGGLIQWAEPETHGEAFIPLAPGKRARSLDIWKETGRLLGAFDATPFANGAVRSIAANVPAITLPGLSQASATQAGRTLTDADINALAKAIRENSQSEKPPVVIKQTNYNPQTVPVVEQTQQALMTVAALGDLGNV